MQSFVNFAGINDQNQLATSGLPAFVSKRYKIVNGIKD